MARARKRGNVTTERERIRLRELERVRDLAADLAAIVVRLPRDLEQVAESEARHDLLSEYGLTAATEADHGRDPLELVAGTACHSAFLLGQQGPRWTGDEFYTPSWAEVCAIAEEELERVRPT